MKKGINKEKMIRKMESEKVKVISIDKDNNTFMCENGIEYPIMDGCEDFTIDELQTLIDEAKVVTVNILKSIKEKE